MCLAMKQLYFSMGSHKPTQTDRQIDGQYAILRLALFTEPLPENNPVSLAWKTNIFLGGNLVAESYPLI